jgi:eukaryotic-like serine/threonine-protein kinase
MSLCAGVRLGPYEITSALGAGGMGEVYRARDTRLDRTVAIKVLPAHLAESPERRQRLEREARAISSLSHPHICMLHDVGEIDGTFFLVLEYLEGETLKDRLKRGPLPLDQVLRYGVEIAGALDRAHRQGIVHRDLKPGNVMLTKSGAKLLDFGLAKQAPDAPVSSASELSALLTGDKPLTAEGSILGTFQYMAPEQLEGKEPDTRADLFAFGAVLHEMATGERAFKGKSQASLIAAILAADPVPMSRLQPLTPPALERVVAMCLAKDRDERWQSAHDLERELQWIRDGGSEPARRPAGRSSKRERTLWTAAVLAAALAGFLASRWRDAAPPPTRVIQSALLPPPKTTFARGSFFDGPPVLSPDGQRIVFVLRSEDGRSRLWVRALEEEAARPLPGTEGASYPFWSADSRALGFFAETKLKRIDAAGAPPQVLCSAPAGRGGAWNHEGVIVFTGPVGTGLYRVAASGGEPVAVTHPEGNESSHRWPFFLPGGRRFVYTVLRSGGAEDAIFLGSLDSPDRRQLVAARSNSAYAAPGYLLFVRERALMAQPFDATRGEITGDAVRVADPVQTFPPVAIAAFSVSETGLLTYQAGTGEVSQAVWVDRAGRRSETGIAPGPIGSLRLAHDGRRVAYQVEDHLGRGDIWIQDLARGVPSRLTVDPANDFDPVWAPDDQSIIFSSNRTGGGDLYRKPTWGGSAEELLLASNYRKGATDWSRDGHTLYYNEFGATTRQDMWSLSLPDRRPKVILQTEFFESASAPSPDGRWIAYHSDESGRQEVYVRAFPGPGATSRVSREGGTHPRWRADGRELFFTSDEGRFMAVEVKTGATFEAGEPKLLFVARLRRSLAREYDVTPDGQRFLVAVASSDDVMPPLTLIQNWSAALKH